MSLLKAEVSKYPGNIDDGYLFNNLLSCYENHIVGCFSHSKGPLLSASRSTHPFNKIRDISIGGSKFYEPSVDFNEFFFKEFINLDLNIVVKVRIKNNPDNSVLKGAIY